MPLCSFTLRFTSLAVLLVLMNGCQSGPGFSNIQFADRSSDPYTQSNFDELLDFGANMSNMPVSARIKTCRSLLKRQKDAPGASINLHLLVGRLLSDACGDISKVLDEVTTIPADALVDIRMRRFVAFNTDILRRMRNAPKKIGSFEHKQKMTDSIPESNDVKGSNKNETNLLRQKLEAIRSMEKQLDKSNPQE